MLIICLIQCCYQLENSKLVIKDLENKDRKIVGLKNKQLGLNRDEISCLNKNSKKEI